MSALDFYYILEDRKPVAVDLHAWGKWMNLRDNKRVAHDVIGGIRVSTVFLGLNYAFDKGPPLFFETMIFAEPEDGPHPFSESYCDRYTTWDEAVLGHAVAVKIAKDMAKKKTPSTVKVLTKDESDTLKCTLCHKTFESSAGHSREDAITKAINDGLITSAEAMNYENFLLVCDQCYQQVVAWRKTTLILKE